MILLPPTRIVILDDHELYRIGLRSTITTISNQLTIVAECSTKKEMTLLLQQGAQFDLAILDIQLPDGSGIDIAAHLKSSFPQIKIIVLSSEVTTERVNQLLSLDVEGYMSKMAQMSDVEKAIVSALNGNKYYGQSVAKIMYDLYLIKKSFTSREIEIIQHLCNGASAKQVGNKLNISHRTVETHRNNILHKLGFNSTAEMIKYAVKNGIVEWT